MTNKDGGPAYPHTKVFENGTGRAQNGMSLRDYFAAKAMQGLIAADDTIFHHAAAEQGYLHADAMLAARATPQPDPVREELVELLILAKPYVYDALDALVRGTAGEEQCRNVYGKIKSALSKAKEGTS